MISDLTVIHLILGVVSSVNACGTQQIEFSCDYHT